jgi:hypothetical protein
MRVTSVTRAAHFATDCTRDSASISAGAPIPESARGDAPPMHTIGTEAREAFAIAVTTSVIPGPAVATTTPGMPLTLA